MAVPGTFTSGQVLTAAEMNALPGGLVDFSQETSSASLTTSPTTVSTVTVDLVAGRKYLITANAFSFLTSTTMVITVRLTVGGTTVQRLDAASSSTLDETNLSLFTVHTAAASGSVAIAYVAQTSTGTSVAYGSAADGGAALAVIDLGD